MVLMFQKQLEKNKLKIKVNKLVIMILSMLHQCHQVLNKLTQLHQHSLAWTTFAQLNKYSNSVSQSQATVV